MVTHGGKATCAPPVWVTVCLSQWNMELPDLAGSINW